MSVKAVLVLILFMAGIVLISVLLAVAISRLVKKKKENQADGGDLLERKVSAARQIVAPDGGKPQPVVLFYPE